MGHLPNMGNGGRELLNTSRLLQGKQEAGYSVSFLEYYNVEKNSEI